MFDSKEVIDLSNPICAGIPVWPSFPQVELDQTSIAARDGFTMERIEMRSHTATHIDAPAHFIPDGKTLDDFSIERFMGEGVVIDLTPKDPEEAITRADIEAYEDDIEQGDVVMLHTGWDEYYGQTPEYLFEFPYLTGDAAEYIASLEPTAVGTEGASVGGWYDEVPAHGPSTDVHPADSHLPLLENEIIPIEEVRNLDQVLDGADSRRADFFFPPLNVQGTGGCSVRAFALV
ncbi:MULTISPECIES: cyclase family protein [Haloferax]|uniref:Cyclase family protein n=2 Tax=Haloferax TaxID=2251 RepID=A0A6G1Z673_9EURY|nr:MULTISPECIES: cyclase family protein [Haloferax]KAB1185338.1 cyclase family protein [Haloferax sp. CBA1149]MRW81975.1 cyclase family protein [Haloferax marinisediminis]